MTRAEHLGLFRSLYSSLLVLDHSVDRTNLPNQSVDVLKKRIQGGKPQNSTKHVSVQSWQKLLGNSEAWSWASLVARGYSPSSKWPCNNSPTTESISTRRPRRACRTYTPLRKTWHSAPLTWPKSCLLTPCTPVVVTPPGRGWAGSGSLPQTRTTHSTRHTYGGLHSHHRSSGR